MPRRSPWLACALATALGSRAGAEPPEPDGGVAPDGAARPAETVGPYEDFAAAPVFLPRSYVYWATPSGGRTRTQPLLLAVEYSFHLPAYNDLRAKAAQGGRWAGAATFSFGGAFRMLHEYSKPIRMPSYRPSLSGQVFRLYHRPHPVIWGLKLQISHESNGQERCMFDPALLSHSLACRSLIPSIEEPAEQLNRRSGDFSNSTLSLRFDTRAHTLDSRGVAVSHLSAGIGLGVHLPGHFAGMLPELREFYGAGRLRTHLELQRDLRRTLVSASLDMRYFFRTRNDVPSTSGWITLTARPHRLIGFGFFVRYFGGRDFYNAFFVDQIQQFSMGITWDSEKPLRFSPEMP